MSMVKVLTRDLGPSARKRMNSRTPVSENQWVFLELEAVSMSIQVSEGLFQKTAACLDSMKGTAPYRAILSLSSYSNTSRL